MVLTHFEVLSHTLIQLIEESFEGGEVNMILILETRMVFRKLNKLLKGNASLVILAQKWFP